MAAAGGDEAMDTHADASGEGAVALSMPSPADGDASAGDAGAGAAAAAVPAAAGTKKGKKPRFTIKKWSAVAMWSWDLLVDTCAICRNSLYEPSIEYQANPGAANNDGIQIAWGCCGHVFHLDCIARWLRTRSVCPLCNQEWEYSKVESIADVGYTEDAD